MQHLLAVYSVQFDCYTHTHTHTHTLCTRYNISTDDYQAWGEQAVNSSFRRINQAVFDGEQGTRNRPFSNISSVYENYFDFDTAKEVCVYV